MAENFHSLTQVSPLITNEVLNKQLSQWLGKNVTFTRWEYVGSAGKGDSYLSDFLRIKIHGKDDKDVSEYVHVALKTMPKSVSRKRTFRIHDFFKNEIMFYQHVLPELLKFQAEKKVTEPYENYPKYFMGGFDGDNDFIGLEDLNIYGFGPVVVRQDGIDYDHCEVVLKTFAKFHAISFAMKDQQPARFEKIANHLTEVYYKPELWAWYERFWARLSRIAIDAVEKEYPNSKYSEKIKEFASPSIYSKLCNAALNTKETGVISHGDAWTNNFMFKYADNSKVAVDTRMIDFQLSRYATPALDISFFIYACTTKPLRDEKYNDMLKYYYRVLSNQIREMGSDSEKVYSWDRFMKDIRCYSFFGLAFSFESTPFIVLDPEDAVDMTMEGDETKNIEDVWQVGPFKTQAGRRREADNFVHAVDHGFVQ